MTQSEALVLCGIGAEAEGPTGNPAYYSSYILTHINSENVWQSGSFITVFEEAEIGLGSRPADK